VANVVGVIMAGGQGSRLYPLTKVRSKPAVPVAGRFRLIDIALSNCIHSNVRSIFVLTQFASESLHRHIFTTYRFDSFHRDFITLLSAQQTLDNRNWYQGTADAVRQNLDFIEDAGALVLVLSGDHLYRMDYRKFVDFHVSSGAEISIALTPVRAEQAHDLGVMKVDSRGRITEFREKPKDAADIERMRVDESIFERFGAPANGRTHLASMGVYLFSQSVLRDLLAHTDSRDFGKEVIPHAIGERKVFGHFFDGYWEDIGTIRTFFDAHMDLTRPLPKFDFYDEERPIFTFPRFLPGCKILGADVANAILCEGSIVNRSRIRDAIVGIRSRVGENDRLERAVIMGADTYESREDIARNRERGVPAVGIGNDCEIRNAIVDKNARIGHGVRLVNANGVAAATAENYSIVDGIIVIPKGAIVPDGTVI
jgi:glucose-1-phosphate adenylyltransferase